MEQLSDPFALPSNTTNSVSLQKTEQTDCTKMALTAAAAKQILLLKKQENQPLARLRITVSGGGCAGYQYHFAWDDHENQGDHIFSLDGAEIIVDNTSIEFLNSCNLDYVDELIGSSFKINNPNATSSCSCGTSFAF